MATYVCGVGVAQVQDMLLAEATTWPTPQSRFADAIHALRKDEWAGEVFVRFVAPRVFQLNIIIVSSAGAAWDASSDLNPDWPYVLLAHSIVRGHPYHYVSAVSAATH